MSEESSRQGTLVQILIDKSGFNSQGSYHETTTPGVQVRTGPLINAYCGIMMILKPGIVLEASKWTSSTQRGGGDPRKAVSPNNSLLTKSIKHAHAQQRKDEEQGREMARIIFFSIYILLSTQCFRTEPMKYEALLKHIRSSLL